MIRRKVRARTMRKGSMRFFGVTDRWHREVNVVKGREGGSKVVLG